MATQKKLSLILAAMDSYQEIKDVLAHVERQTIRDQCEVVVVCGTLGRLNDKDGSLQNSDTLQVIEGGAEIQIHEARAIGIRASRCACVATLEDHCFPEPGWAEALLARLEEGWTGVGPVFSPANPHTSVAQAMHLVCYGQWLAPMASRAISFIAGHNSAYQRKVLIERGDRLALDMAVPSAMQVELRAQGHRLYLEGAALVRHWDAAVWQGVPVTLVALGRVIGFRRALRWGWGKKLLAGFAVPAVAGVRWLRAVTAWWRGKKRYQFSWGTPFFAAIMAVQWTVAEWWGCLFAGADCLQKLNDVEHDRCRFLRPGEWPHPNRAYSVERQGTNSGG